MVAYEQVQSKRITATDFEPVERRQGIVYRTQGSNLAMGAAGTAKCADSLRDAEPIAKHCPQGVLDRAASSVEVFGDHRAAFEGLVGGRGQRIC